MFGDRAAVKRLAVLFSACKPREKLYATIAAYTHVCSWMDKRVDGNLPILGIYSVSSLSNILPKPHHSPPSALGLVPGALMKSNAWSEGEAHPESVPELFAEWGTSSFSSWQQRLPLLVLRDQGKLAESIAWVHALALR